MNNSKKIGLIIGIFSFILLMIGATMAYWIWRGNLSSVNVTGYKPFECSADGGIHESTDALMPASCTHERYAIQREITVDYDLFSPNTSVYMDMILTVNNIGSGLSGSSNFKYAVTASPYSCSKDVISSGTFKGVSNGSTIRLFDDRSYDLKGENIINKYYLYIWIDPKEENRNILNQNFSFSLELECTHGYESGATMLINKANNASVTTYSEGNTGEMYTFSQPETEQLSATTDYRYIGSNPNNYITFNNETWRIIGVFDGKIKIIKDEYIGNLFWDYKGNGVGSSLHERGSNDWEDSQLMYFLNSNDIATNVALKTGYTYDGTYVKDANGKIIYQKGCNPASTSGTSYSCTSNSWSLNDDALSQVTDITYHLGGGRYNSTTNYGTTVDIYTWERGNEKSYDLRNINWTGKVGLMYPSDYSYTFAYGVDNMCYNDPDNCNNTQSNSWLMRYHWTLSPYYNTSYGVMTVDSTGGITYTYANSDSKVRPVVYLKDSTLLIGDGTSKNPYIISTVDS